VLAEHGIPRESVTLHDGSFSFEGGWAATERFINERADFAGIFCANDEMAMGAMSCLQERGIRVPSEVSVVGYDDTVMSAFTTPRLTSVAIPMCEMAASGCRWLLNQCFGTTLEVHRQYSINVTWRASVADCKRG